MVDVTIAHHNGVETVTDFAFIEERHDSPDSHTSVPGTGENVRVWWSDPEVDDDDYSDFYNASITEVSP